MGAPAVPTSGERNVAQRTAMSYNNGRFTQVMGLAFGVPPEELGLGNHVEPRSELLSIEKDVVSA